MNINERASGVLLHPTSLPGPHGVGDLGPSSRRFVEFLAAAGQRWWQMLPLGPPGYWDSPYQPLSAFAGNPLLISLELLADEGLLTRDEVAPVLRVTRTDYAQAARFREPRLRAAYARQGHHEEFSQFCHDNADWLDDFALFCALKQAHRGAPWTALDKDLRLRRRAAIEHARASLAQEMRYHAFLQFLFNRQWSALRAEAAKLGVGIIGDAPMFVAHDSADCWVHPELFQLDAEGRPKVMAGVPPDCFDDQGQIWGNPLYRWGVLGERNYDWWIARLRALFARVDVVRLDHFIGFHRSWAILPKARSGRQGRWLPGPGADLFKEVAKTIPSAQFVAEDLGLVTPEVARLRDDFGFPGMRVLQFAFGGDSDSEHHLPHRYPRHTVVYTGTHDNDTLAGYLARGGKSLQARVRRYLGHGQDGPALAQGLIRLALSSVANTAIFPMQDLLGLGSRDRMNRPGVARGNWRWRLGALDKELAESLGTLTATYGRKGGQ